MHVCVGDSRGHSDSSQAPWSYAIWNIAGTEYPRDRSEDTILVGSPDLYRFTATAA